MDTENNQTTRKINTHIYVCCSILLGFFLFLSLDRFLPHFLSNFKKGKEIGYREGYSKAVKIFDESYAGRSVAVPEDIRIISGNIIKLNGNTGVVIHSQSNNPFSDKNLDDRTVLIGKETVISKLTNSPFVVQSTTSVALSNLVIGSPVNIIAYENIANLKEFKAKEIQIQSQGEPGVISTSTKLK